MLAILKGSFTDGGLPKPFIKEIFLLHCNVAGTSFLELEDIEETLLINDILILKREPNNQYDKLAVLILDQNGNKLGYIPKEKNEVLARLMDAGKLIFVKLEAKEWQGSWLKLTIRVYMRDI